MNNLATELNKTRNKYSMLRITISALCVICFFTLIVQNAIIASESMEPTLRTHDIVFFNKLAYHFDDVSRGDIIGFYSEEIDYPLCKRIIGIPGDIIEFDYDKIYINGLLINESAYLGNTKDINRNLTYVVPEGCVFVMGDFRFISHDSRYFKNPYIPIESIIGKYLGTISFAEIYDRLDNIFRFGVSTKK